MKTTRSIFLLCFLAVSSWVYATGATYSFCVKSDDFESFKASVTFTNVDFGEPAAKLILMQQLNKKLDTKVKLLPYFSDKNCGCSGNACKEIVLRADKIKGTFRVNETGSSSEAPAAAIGTVDKVVGEAKKMVDNPKLILDEAVKMGSKLLDKIF